MTLGRIFSAPLSLLPPPLAESAILDK
jgi:hypothetical protein